MSLKIRFVKLASMIALSALFAVAIPSYASNHLIKESKIVPQSQAHKEVRVAALVPVIMMLLEDRRIQLRVGQVNSSGYNSSDFPNGIDFSFRPNGQPLDLELQISQLASEQHLTVFYNGEEIASLGNGQYQLSLPNSVDSIASLQFVASPADSTWQIDSILLLNQAGPRTRAQAQRFLTKATFGATHSNIVEIMELGYEGWVDRQLSLSPTLNQPFFEQAIINRKAGRNQLLQAAGETDPEVLERGLGLGNLCVSRMDAWWNGSIRGIDQLRQRMAFALSQIMVLGDTGCEGGPPRAFAIYYDILLNNAFGNYRQLLNDVTLNPMMGNYLSLRGSASTTAGPFFSPDENYAREVMQLYSIGLTELNIDGSEKLVDGEPVETYTNAEVHDLARALTGWQVATGRFFPGWEAFPLEPWGEDGGRFHDRGSKTLINGVVLPPNLPIEEDLKRSLDTISTHDNVGPFISKQLIQRFVTSNPSPNYIERVARVFNDNGQGERGDLGAVIKAILLDQESLNSHLDLNSGKLKEPLLRVSQLWRAFNAQSPIRYIRYFHSGRDLGQRALAADSVFNFYPPSFAPAGEIEDAGLVAPEFKLTGDAQNLRYYTRMAQIIQSSEFGDPNPIYSPSFNLPMKLNLERAKSIAASGNAFLVDYLNELLLGGLMTDALRNLVLDYLDALPREGSTADYRETLVEEALLLIAVSPEFNVQR